MPAISGGNYSVEKTVYKLETWPDESQNDLVANRNILIHEASSVHGQMMEYPLTIDRLLEHAVSIYGHKQIHSKCDDGGMHRYSYTAMYKRCKQLANALTHLGVRRGECVGTFAWNNYQHLELYYGIPAVGAICHTLNIRLSPDQLVYIIEHAGNRVIFVDASLLPLIEPLRHRVKTVEHYIVFNDEFQGIPEWPEILRYEDLLQAESETFDWLPLHENTASGLCYTSGTTGNPKGALYSHRSTYLHAMYSNQANSFAFCETDRVLTIVPQFHVMAWGFPYSCLYAGADIVLPGKFLDPESLAALLRDQKITIANGVPTIWTGVYEELKKNPGDLSNVRALVIGGAAMPQSMMEAFEREFGIQTLHAWGMTEMSPLGTLSRLQSRHQVLSDAEKRRLRARQGIPFPGVERRIVDDRMQVIEPGSDASGEIQVRGACIIGSYFKAEPDSEHFTEDGWFRTGDVAQVDEQGYMQITDRTKDLIRSGGEWVSSIALETALSGHPGILEAAVIAIADEKWGERPLAVVVPQPNSKEPTLDDIRQFLSQDFAKFWLPDRLEIVDEVPKTSTGKFDKKRLRQLYTNDD